MRFFKKKRGKKRENPDFDEGLKNPFSEIVDDHRNSVFENMIFEGFGNPILKIGGRRWIPLVEIYKSSKTASTTASERVRYGHLKSTP